MEVHEEHPLAAALAQEQKEYQHEIEGAPWWMPIDPGINYEPGAPGAPPEIFDHDGEQRGGERSSISVFDDDVSHMDAMKLVVENNAWMQQIANNRGDQAAQRRYLLSIDYQVNCRKFLLFTSILLSLVLATGAMSIYSGFYELKGNIFNSVVLGIMLYGIVVGIVCTQLKQCGLRPVLWVLNLYWAIAWLTVVCLFATACVYLVLFPQKFKRHCAEHQCDATLEAIIFAECSLFCSLLLYIFLMFFYMQRIAVLHLLSCNLYGYQYNTEQRLFMRVCHRHIYRYIQGWKRFRRTIAKYIGFRLNDVLYCSCLFRSCRRKSSRQWRPIHASQSDTDLMYGANEVAVRQPYAAIDDDISDHDAQYQEEAQPGQAPRKSKPAVVADNAGNGGGGGVGGPYVVGGYYGPVDNGDCGCCASCCHCCHCCECWHESVTECKVGCADACDGCHECCTECCGSLRHCCVCNGDNCFCCLIYSVPHHHGGDCSECCRGCGQICGGCCSDCGDCNCNGCGGGSGDAAGGICAGIGIGIACVALFLLPIIVFALLAAPFWIFAQFCCSKLNNKVPWIMVILIFILCLIPPCALWGLIWTLICYGNISGTFMTVMCLIWSFFHTIYSAFAS